MPFDANDPETKAAIEAIKADAAEKFDSEVSGLKSKVDGLIAANKKLKQGQEIDPAEVDRLESEVDQWKAKATAAEKAAKDASKAAETATKALEAETGATRRLLVENGLREALTASGVTNPVHQKAAMAMLAGGVEVVTEGDTRIAKAGGKALADFAKEWAAGDEGKHFVSAPINGGGGATGGSGPGTGKSISQTEFAAMPAKVKAAKMAEGYTIAEAA